MSKKSKRNQDHVNQFLFGETEDLKRAMRNHSHMHNANDLLPQFKRLCEKVENIAVRLTMEGAAQSDQNRRLTELKADNVKLWENVGKLEIRIDEREVTAAQTLQVIGDQAAEIRELKKRLDAMEKKKIK